MERPPLQQQNRGADNTRSAGAGAEGSHAMWGHLPLLVQANSKDSVEYILQALWRTRKTGLDAADRAILRDMLHLQSDADLDPVRLQSRFLPSTHSPPLVTTCGLSPHLEVKLSPLLWFHVLPPPPTPFFRQLLVCLRMLIRRCVHGNIGRDEIQKLFPKEVSPELQRLLTLLLLKFQREWREDVHRDQVPVGALRALPPILSGSSFLLLFLTLVSFRSAQVSVPRLKAMTWNMADQNTTDAGDHIAVLNLKVPNPAYWVNSFLLCAVFYSAYLSILLRQKTETTVCGFRPGLAKLESPI